MKLHLGCGSKHLPGYVHVDIAEHEHVDIVADLANLPPMPEPVTEIYACHVLEHFDRNTVKQVLQSWVDLLEPGGVLRIAVPDVGAVVAEYAENGGLGTLLGLLYGGQRDEYDYHKCGFDFETLSAMLIECGCETVERYDWRTFLPPGFDDYSRAYLPHMATETGRLMSLNVEAKKNG
jgi:predicted SAM-dependent methyltransferase